MKIKVLNRETFENFKSDESFVVISITDPNSEKVKIKNKPIDILFLQFYDLDKDTAIFPYSRFIFNTNQAEQILNFIEEYKDKVNLIVVHCEAGISRSAGVAGALSLIYNGSDEYYFKHYLPNIFVYRTILNMYMKNKKEKLC